ncbi:hypothetical protein Aperf_G00000065887 [Anoplocephala perfoliata]
MSRSYECFLITLFITTLPTQSNGKIITSGTSEWGTLCNLNGTYFQFERVDQENEMPSLYPSLRNMETRNKSRHSPCCFPRKWEASFIVHTRRIGKTPRSDRCLYRISRKTSNTSIVDAVMAIGQMVLSTSFCGDWSGTSIRTCSSDEKYCLYKPFLGEPRCISEENGFSYVSGEESSKHEVWFTDARIPTGGVRRQVYIFRRKYEICRLERYEILIGQYVDSKTNCRMMFLMDQIFIPTPKSFAINFDHDITDGMFRC